MPTTAVVASDVSVLFARSFGTRFAANAPATPSSNTIVSRLPAHVATAVRIHRSLPPVQRKPPPQTPPTQPRVPIGPIATSTSVHHCPIHVENAKSAAETTAIPTKSQRDFTARILM